MISPKFAVLMAAFAVVGMAALPGSTVFAEENKNGYTNGYTNGGNNGGDAVAVEAERNNEIDQNLEQEQEACTNELEAEVSDDDLIDIGGDNTATADQANNCVVTQNQVGTNTAGIVDNSVNDLGVEAILAEVGLVL